MDKMFEQATRMGLRFESTKGFLSVEDVWNLDLVVSENRKQSVPSLDELAKAVNRKLKAEEEESFVTVKSTKNKELELQLELLKYIISVKLTEADAKKKRLERRAELELLKSLKEEKQIEALKGMSLDEINAKMLALEAEEA